MISKSISLLLRFGRRQSSLKHLGTLSVLVDQFIIILVELVNKIIVEIVIAYIVYMNSDVVIG